MIRQLCAAALLGLAFFLFADPFIAPPDCASYWAWAESIYGDFDLAFTDEYAAARFPTFYLYHTATDRISNDWPPGTGLLIGPLALLPPIYAHAWLALLAIAALFAFQRHVRQQFSPTAVRIAVAATVAGTPLLFYLSSGPFFAHVASFVFTTLFLVAWARTLGTATRNWFLLGLLLGVAAVIRPQNLALGIVFLMEPRRLREGTLHFSFGLLLGCAPQLVAWSVLYGGPLALPKVEEMRWFSPALMQVLLSDFHGILPWTPLYVLGFIGLCKLPSPLRYGLLLVLVSQLYINAANMVWWAGGSFGNRRIVDSAIIVAWGLTALSATRRSRAGFAITIAAIALCCLWTFLLLLAERAGRLPLGRYVPFRSPLFVDEFVQTFTDPLATWNGLTRGLRIGQGGVLVLLHRAVAAVLLATGTMLLLRWNAKPTADESTRRFPGWLSLSTVLGSFAAVTLAITTISALRTPKIEIDQSINKLGSASGILWDNYIELAYYELLRGRYEESRVAALEAVKLRPNHYAGWFNVGRAFYLGGNPTDARLAFEETLRLNPDHEISKQLLGKIASGKAPAPW